MPTTKEFTIRMEDRPGTLGEVSRALADKKVNVIAFQSFPSAEEGESTVRLVVDNPTTAKSVLDTEGLRYKENEVAQISLPHRPGELSRVATRLGEANININYAYCGVDPGTKAALLFFGVKEVSKAAGILDDTAKAA